MDLLKEIEGITDVKCDCTIQELVNHINTLSTHFGGHFFSENDVLEAVRFLENRDTGNVVLIKEITGLEKQMPDNLPWQVIRINPQLKFAPDDLDHVPF